MDYRRLIANVLLAALLALTVVAGASAQSPTPSPRAFHLLEARIADIHAALQSGQLTCRELTSLYLKRIQAYDKSGPSLNAVQTINPHALDEAARLDDALRSSRMRMRMLVV